MTELVIRTSEDGYNAGRTYVHTVEEAEADDWLRDLQSAMLAADL